MSRKRYIKQDQSSFFGEYLYDQIVPKNHFYRSLNEIIDWTRFTEKLIELYKGGGEYGRPPYDPALVLKMLFVSYLYNISERHTEIYVNENVPAKYFVGLAMDRPAPDHSTLTYFKKRLIKKGNLEVFEDMLCELIQIALEKGIKFGSIQIIDSVHTVAHVNTMKDRNRNKKGKAPLDPDAKWGAKHKRKVKTKEGKTIEQTQYFHGYKAHTSMNAENNLITSILPSSGEAWDGKYFKPLVEMDLAQSLPMDTVAADRGYDDHDLHYFLQEEKGLHSGILLKSTRTQKKDKNKEVWFRLMETPQYQQAKKERYKIERKFGEAKSGHGLARCRYVSLLKFGVQAFITAIVLNLKRMVKILNDVSFRPRNYSPA
jgi:IS5 family transposase